MKLKYSGSKVVLDLCSGTGSWSSPYTRNGYEVVRVELTEGRDVRLEHYIDKPIQGILCAPPCTVFAVSGNRWERTTEDYLEALSVVDACLRMVAIYKPKWWALENPRGKLSRYLGPPRLRFDPCDYGNYYVKKTCVWGDFHLPVKTLVVPSLGSAVHTKLRSKESRSVTPSGFANAFYRANP